MPSYEEFLRNTILHECGSASKSSTASLTTLPLSGLRIVLNAGNGSGYFFNKILKDLGADVSNSIHLTPDGTFPASGVPNPEYSAMIDETKSVCEECEADIGIMLDTDADRCGFIVPRSDGTTLRYETSGHCAMREVSFFQNLYNVCNQNLQLRTYFLMFLSN
jgi:phosphomannomutase